MPGKSGRLTPNSLTAFQAASGEFFIVSHTCFFVGGSIPHTAPSSTGSALPKATLSSFISRIIPQASVSSHVVTAKAAPTPTTGIASAGMAATLSAALRVVRSAIREVIFSTALFLDRLLAFRPPTSATNLAFCLFRPSASATSLVFCLLRPSTSATSLPFCLFRPSAAAASLAFCLFRPSAAAASLAFCLFTSSAAATSLRCFFLRVSLSCLRLLATAEIPVAEANISPIAKAPVCQASMVAFIRRKLTNIKIMTVAKTVLKAK